MYAYAREVRPSRPTRARGLKLDHVLHFFRRIHVAPHAGAWIETVPWLGDVFEAIGRAPRGRVD